MLTFTSHNMALEAQSLDAESEQAQLQQLITALLDKSGSALWEDE